MPAAPPRPVEKPTHACGSAHSTGQLPAVILPVKPVPVPSPAIIPPVAGKPVSYLVPPAAAPAPAGDERPRMIKVILRANGDKDREVRRLKRVLGVLRSCPGRDRFALLVFEKGSYFLVEFPNDTTGYSPDLQRRLLELVGEENLQVEFLTIQ